MYRDTIAAIATPSGPGAIAVLRVSGPQALPLVQRVFSRKLAPRRMAAGQLVDPVSGAPVDEVMAVFLPGPRSYTGEDMVEVYCHGGALPVQQTLALLLRTGARCAEPGEFTLRAYLAGRLDLAQAEAVMDVVAARSARALQAALGTLKGGLSERVRDLRARVLRVLAYLTAAADFPDEDIAPEEIQSPLHQALAAAGALLATAAEGAALRDGVRTAIVGLPNAGKSSLLNRLLGQDRAIVSPVPGTTRDTLSETAVIDGIPFVLTDTAGMVRTGDPIEALGVERARKEAAAADLLLVVVDGAGPVTEEARALAAGLPAHPAILAINKADLPQAATSDAWSAALGRVFAQVLPVSALTGHGVPALQHAMTAAVRGQPADTQASPLVANPRHIAALQQAHASIQAALSALDHGTPPDLVAIDLGNAVNALGQITGETASADLLDQIFSQFCIGK